MTTEDTAALGK